MATIEVGLRCRAHFRQASPRGSIEALEGGDGPAAVGTGMKRRTLPKRQVTVPMPRRRYPVPVPPPKSRAG